MWWVAGISVPSGRTSAWIPITEHSRGDAAVTTLQESIDVNAPAEAVWAQLHKMDSYPQFIEGVQSVKKRGSDQAALQVKANGHSQKCDTEIADGRRNEQMTFRVKNSPRIGGTIELRPMGDRRTTMQVRLEYDPQELGNAFGLNGAGHNGVVKQTMQQNMARFKSLVERGRS
jgi:uncharacterized membrane protein